jgi:hypothetical protein
MDAGSGSAAIHSMKVWSRIVLLVAFFGLAGITHKSLAGPACLATLQWQASPDTNVVGYALYYGISGCSATNRLDVGQTTTVTVDSLTASSTYYFFVVAYDVNQQESDPSNFLLYTAPAMSSLWLCQSSDGTINLAFRVAPEAACHVEYTDTLSPPSWNVLTTAVADSNGLVTVNDPVAPAGSRYYRAVIP